MSYRIEVAPAAVRQLRNLDRVAQRRVQAAIELLASEPRPNGAKKLVGGDGGWRVRIGDYRIVHEIHGRMLLVLIVAVGHRRHLRTPLTNSLSCGGWMAYSSGSASCRSAWTRPT